MTITFIGHGYVGLVTACVFADFCNKVWVIGHTPEKINHFTSEYTTPIGESDVVFIAVGTPPKKNGEADLSTVFAVAEKVSQNLEKKITIVSCKSTVPVGTNARIEKILNKLKPKKTHVAVASCPEFLREGTAIYDSLNPDRVVIGSSSKEAVKKLLELHEPINGKRVITNLASAELIKYASNAMLATKISFANFVSFYCEKTGADVEKVLDAVGLDNRIGRVFLYPGVGYGGSCLPKDVKALIDSGKTLGVDTSLLQEVEDINETARKNFLQKLFENFKGKKIAVWGLSFKPNTDDIRFAPSLYILQAFLDKKGANRM